MKNFPLSFLCWALLLVSACSPCHTEKVSDAVSQNRQVTATVVYIGCGAITRDATWVTLHRTGEKSDRSDDIVLSAVQQQRLDIAWADDSHLSIYCHCHDDDVQFQVSKKGSINISYR